MNRPNVAASNGLYALALGFSLASAPRLFATPMPDSYPLLPAGKTAVTQDSAFMSWIDQHAQLSDSDATPIELDQREFKKFLTSQDSLTQLLLNLRYAKQRKLPMEAVIKVTADRLIHSPQESDKTHPLTPYLWSELLDTESLDKEQAQKGSDFIEVQAPLSCAAKDVLMQRAAQKVKSELSGRDASAMIDRISAFKSKNFRVRALSTLVKDMPEDTREPLKERLVNLAEEMPQLADDAPWLREWTATAKASRSAEKTVRVNFEEVKLALQRRQCPAAKDKLLEVIRGAKDANAQTQTFEITQDVASCFRSKGEELRRIFWDEIAAPLQEEFGLVGWAFTRQHVANILWNGDNFADARAIFKDIVTKANEKGERTTEARAVFSLARLEENEGNFAEAVGLFDRYVNEFASEESFDKALTSLILIHAQNKEWDEALVELIKVIDLQSAFGTDQRSSQTMGFALFWAGRIYHMKNRKDEAQEMWRRVASEYYSTFYGALGHFMLEKTLSRKLQLEPTRTNTFSDASLSDAFPEAGQGTVKRAMALLRAGLAREARCELSELSVADKRPEAIAAKALLLHASGDWLESIKLYDTLPRSFRSTLPVGYERILMPRAYESYVEREARRVGIDKDIVFAVIRQESVFNPRAQSLVGARGLMQLMPPTALMEAKVHKPAAMRKIRHLTTDAMEAHLYDPEVNVTLGAQHVNRLLRKYRNPILALASYNANPKVVERWAKTIPSNDFLIFIERIPYQETRGYVKLVLRNYFYYKRWYDGPNKAMPYFDMVTSSMTPIKPVKGASSAHRGEVKLKSTVKQIEAN